MNRTERPATRGSRAHEAQPAAERPRAAPAEAQRPAEMRQSAEMQQPAAMRRVLKEHGLRYSRPREVILGYLFEEDRHVSAESLYLELKQRGEELSLSTVYLNLSVLADAGLVREFKSPNGLSVYDSNVSPHYHVVCRDTGEVLDVPAPEVDGVPLGRFLKEYVEALTGWEVDEPRLSFTGRTAEAARRAKASDDE